MICFPLDRINYDASAMGLYLATRTRGVFSANANLQVSANGAMSVSVSAGIAWLKWSEYWGVATLQDIAITLAIERADGALTRIDTVVCRLNKIENMAEIYIKKGAYSASPAILPPVRNDNYDEIYLATIKVSAGAVKIVQADITDQRLNETYCGIMRDGVTGIPTAALQSQAEELIAKLGTLIKSTLDGSIQMLKAIYDTNNSGAVDNAERLGNELPEYFQPKTDSTLATENKTVAGAINGIIDGTYTVGNASMLGNVVSSEYLKMQKATTLNVSLSGSDTLGDGSTAKPYKTIQKAVDSLSKYLIGDVTIKVADGVYNENVSVKGFVGIGMLSIKSTAGDSINPNDYDRCKLKWVAVISCSARIGIFGFTLTTLNSTVWYGSLATILNCQHVALRIKAAVNTMGGDGSLSAVNIQNSGVIFVDGSLIQNQRRGIFANQNSRVFIMNIVVNNCTEALCSEASVISISWTSQITGTLTKGDGGLITYGGGLFK